MSWFNPKAEMPETKKKERSSLTLFASDDLLKRAENIVYFIGFRGDTGNYVLETLRLLNEYERLDREAAKGVEDIGP